ncbi:hypothetical protein OROMI_004435 [Orobanche minor]
MSIARFFRWIGLQDFEFACLGHKFTEHWCKSEVVRRSVRRRSSFLDRPPYRRFRANIVRSLVIHVAWPRDYITGLSESDVVGIRTLLPSRFMEFQLEYDNFMKSYQLSLKKAERDPEVVVSSETLRMLNGLHDSNESLYYRVLIEKFKVFASIVYTPTVGLLCHNRSVTVPWNALKCRRAGEN